jgi:hypothetical protein
MKKMLVMLVIALVALMGNASAAGAEFSDIAGNLLPDTIVQQVGTPYDYSLKFTGFSNENVTIAVNAASTSSGVTVDLAKTELGILPSDPYVEPNVVTITIDEGAVQGQEFAVTIDVYRDELPEEPAYQAQFRAAASKDFSASIPEFPTVALPVAAILGLAFFMQRRKEE